MDQHPGDAVLAEYAQGDVSGAPLADVELHLSSCAECRSVVAQLLKVLGSSVERGPRRGLVVGRYVVLDPVGAGALGEVFSAYDSTLERTVALKWLFPAVTGKDRDALRTRLVDEGRALAKVQHPNVVSVHDVVEHDGADVIVMELVRQAVTLRVASKGTSWNETVERFIDAGRGLAAAHDAGVLHRDFKPDNVLLDASGRVVVVDFGLARDVELDTPSPHDVTRRSTVSGTPAYLAPERWLGKPSDAASDQFSFCVALIECLSGALPFTGGTVDARLAEVRAGPSALPAAVSRRVAAAVRRGLSFEPQSRWPSMAALVTELADALEAPRRRRSLMVALGLSVLAAGAVGFSVNRSRARCDGVDAPVRAVWTKEKRDAVNAAFLATKHPAALEVSQRVVTALDGVFEAIASQRLKACVATAREGESDALLDSRQGCLARRLADVDALVRGFSTADGKTVERAVMALESLSPADACLTAATAWEPMPAGPARATVEAVVPKVAQVRALRLLGKTKDSVVLGESVVAEARAAGWRPLTSDALLEWTNGLERLGKLAEARAAGLEAFELAVVAHDERQAFDSAVVLAFLDGVDRKQREAGATWARLARSFVPADQQRASDAVRLANVEGVLLMLDDKAPAAVTLLGGLERSLAKANQLETMNGGRLYANLSAAQRESGLTAESIETAKTSLAVLERVVTANHPDVAAAANNLGSALADFGKLDEAEAYFRRSIELRARLFGPEALQLATPLYNLGETALKRGDGAHALESYGRARAILEKTSADSDDVWDAKMGEGLSLGALGQHEQAVAALTVALTQLEQRKLPAWNIAQAKLGLCESLRALHREEARVVSLLESVKSLAGPRHEAQRTKATAMLSAQR